MLRKVMLSAFAAAALSTLAMAQGQFGTAAEAKAMLEKAIAAVKADKAKAIEMFTKGDGGFKDRDLYPFCFNISDGKIPVAQKGTAAEKLLGTDIRGLKDSTGKEFGKELFAAGAKDQITEVTYLFPKPGTTTPVAKVSYVTKVGDLGCGVGYYK
jgi:signal transduction histidine kinase